MRIVSHALGTSSASAERAKGRGDFFVASSSGGVFRGSKRACAERARWRLVRGQPAGPLSAHYRLECDFGMSILAIYNEGDAVFLCESHLSALATPRDNCIAGVRPVEASTNSDASSCITDSADREKPGSTATAAPSVAGSPREVVAERFDPQSNESRADAGERRANVPMPFVPPPSGERQQPAGYNERSRAVQSSSNESRATVLEASFTRRAIAAPRRESGVTAGRSAIRDLAYGNPAKALVDETIWNMAAGDLEAYQNALEHGKTPIEAAQVAGGQLAVIHRKIAEYRARIEMILSESGARISMPGAVDTPLERAILEIIGNATMGEAQKDAAVDHLGALQEQIKSGLRREITPLEALRIAREIGERANWGGPSDLPQEVRAAYRAVYQSVRDALRAAIPEARDTDERLANLYAAKSAIADTPASKAQHSAAV